MHKNVRAQNALTTIAIDDAVTLLANKLGGVAEARRVMLERAQLGDLLAIAARARGPLDGDFIDEHDWPVPASLWERLDYHSEDEWRRGDFSNFRDLDRYAELRENYYVPLRLVGIKIDIETLGRVAGALPVDWVNAHDAIGMMLTMFGKGMGLAAGMTLAKRAHSGLVKSRARLFKWETMEDVGYGHSKKVQHEAQFAVLPKKFWWANGHEALEQNWVTGDFATWIDNKLHLQAFGTEFDRSDIKAMLPQLSKDESERPEPEQPADVARAEESDLISRTGDPGRPAKAAQLYFAEFESRSRQGLCADTLAEEATALLAWLRDNHPNAAAPTKKTITNRIRSAYRARN